MAGSCCYSYRIGNRVFQDFTSEQLCVSVLDFTPQAEGGSPHICLNRLNQTPNSPVAAGNSGGRKPVSGLYLSVMGPHRLIQRPVLLILWISQ
ncbi:hypothetical protein LWI28_028750 [Acer negundo]|uniref:Uncharacterized protein n=1 Tax=Acer negundo TaxID=4023 RepID=A0AAD5JPG0_ACENE|nr:hypothetical protein LWI28_028750 [Acer negundo]